MYEVAIGLVEHLRPRFPEYRLGVSTVPVPVYTPVQKTFFLPCELGNDPICKTPRPISRFRVRRQNETPFGAEIGPIVQQEVDSHRY